MANFTIDGGPGMAHSLAMQIAKDLRTQVCDLGLTTHAAARALGVSDTTLRRFLAGGNPTLATLSRIERGLARISGTGFPSLESELTDPKTDDAPCADPKVSAAQDG